MTHRFSTNKKIILWPIYILKYCLPLFFISFFGQTFLLILSLFDCHYGKSYYDSELCSRRNNWFYSLIPISVIGLIIQIFMSFVTVSMYYIPDYIINENDILKKRNTSSDIFFLLTKIIFIIIFIFDKKSETEQWGIIIFITLITLFNTYCNIFIQEYSNIIIKRFNNLLSITLFLSFFILLIDKIFQSLEFNGGLYLFYFGLILIILYFYYYSKYYTSFLMINFNNIKSSNECLNYIKKYLEIIVEKEYTYDSQMVFHSLIEQIEENCTNKRCPLKKYLLSLENGINSQFLLLQYAEKLFKIAISKFPKDIILRINYVIFLFTRINKRKEAQKELVLIKPMLFSFSDNFNLYMCKKYLENFSLINTQNDERIETLNMMQEMKYKNYLNEFKSLILKSSSLYYDFWSSLFNYHIQGIEDLTRLNEIGNDLKKMIENIENTFLKLNEIKNNDYEIIKLYESFAKYILNDKEKYKKYHTMSINLIVDKKLKNEDEEVDYANFDLGYLNELEENKYLIISISEEHKGIIVNISLSACPIFGYHKDEIVGKNFNILIPGLFQKAHDNLFKDISEKSKTEFYDSLLNKLIYKPEMIEVNVHGKNKSKYLIPLYLKIYLVQTEESELVYIVEIIKNNLFIGELNDSFNFGDNNDENICCVLTDNNFIIQTFTSNCLNLLKLNSSIINSNVEITSFIKQLEEEYYQNDNIIEKKEFSDFDSSAINKNKNKITFLDKNTINFNKTNLNIENIPEKNNKKFLKLKYASPNKIRWTMESYNKASILYKKYKKVSSLLSNENIYENLNNIKDNKYEKNFLMQIKDANISNKHVGYYFYFQKINYSYEVNKNKSFKSFYKSKVNKKDSSFKHMNQKDDFSFKSNRQNEDEPNIIIGRKVSLHTPDIHKNVNFDFDNLASKKISSSMLVKKKDLGINLDEKFVPESSFNFIFTINSMSYKASNNITLSHLELYDNLKSQAIKKISLIQEALKKKNTNDSSGSKLSSSDVKSSSSDSDSSDSEDSDENDKKETSIINKKKRATLMGANLFGSRINKNNNNKFYNEYYKVKIEDIKLILYDFNKEMFIEKIDNEKISQVENVINTSKSTQNFYTHEYTTHNRSSKEKKNNKNNEKNDNKPNKQDNIKQSYIIKYQKEKEFEKEIKDALSQKDEQKTITNFYLILILCAFLFLALNIYSMIFVIFVYLKLKDNIYLIIDSINLKYFNNYDIYLLREISLFNTYFNFENSNYTVYPAKNNSEYKVNIKKLAISCFSLSHTLLENILSSDLQLSKNSTTFLNQIPYVTETKYDDTNIKITKTPLTVSIIHVLSSFCNLLSSDSINIFNIQVYNYIHNAMNNLGESLNTLIHIFIEELKRREKGISGNIYFIILINTFIYLIIYFTININYFSIVNKKRSYLAVFYGIGLPLIKSSIKKCELFINKINQDYDFEKSGSINNEDSINSNSFSNSKLNTKYLNEFDGKNINNIEEDSIESKKKFKTGTDRRSKFFQMLFIIILIISYLYLGITIILYIFLIKNFVYNSRYLYHMQNYHNNVLYLFNAYREYLFDENSIIFGKSTYNYLIGQENVIYLSNTKDINFLNSNNNYIKNLKKIFLQMNEKGLCSFYITDAFDNKEECENFMGGKEGIISLNFHILVNDFLEELRMIRNYVKLLLNKKLIVGNLSNKDELIKYYDTLDEFYGLNNNKSLIFRMNLFNMNKIHSRINNIFFNIILGYINNERNNTIDLIEKNIINGHAIYIILILSNIIVIMFLVIFFWIPKIKNMNVEIYKAKNILTIIPIQILASLPNIKILLNINNKSEIYINKLIPKKN